MATPTLKDQLAAAVTEAVALRAAVPLECIAYSLLRQGPAPCSKLSEEEYCSHHDLKAALQTVLVSVAEPSAATVGAALLAASEAQRRRCSGVDERAGGCEPVWRRRWLGPGDIALRRRRAPPTRLCFGLNCGRGCGISPMPC